MKISYFSDIHIDMYIHHYNVNGFWTNLNGAKIHSATKPIELIVDRLISNSKEIGEILILAGDIGHNNRQNNKLLEELSNYFEHIFVVLGNHDYYLINSESYRYLHSSHLRVKEMTELISKLPKVTLLTGQIINYKGIKIQGNVGWSDGCYLTKTLKSKLDPQEMYVEGVYLGPGVGWIRMNDSVLIKPYHRFDSMFHSNNISWEKGEVDVMITHYNPSILKKHQDPKYKNDYLTTFYCFDGRKLMKDKRPKLWVYGHSHKGKSYTCGSCLVVNNAIGYPHELGSELKLETVEV